MNRIVAGFCASMLFAAPTFADGVTALNVIPILPYGTVVETINGTQAFDANGTRLAPTTVPSGELPAVVIRESEHHSLNSIAIDEEDTNGRESYPDFVEYTVTNNMVGWDIIGFAVTNFGEYTNPYVAGYKSCGSQIGSTGCWDAERVEDWEVDQARSQVLNALAGSDLTPEMRAELQAELMQIDIFAALLADTRDNALHVYDFFEPIEIDEEIETEVQDVPIDTVYAQIIGNATAITAGTTQSGFYFDHGFAASNIAALATNQQGQFVVISNINLAPVPVPAAGFLLIGGLAGLGLLRRKA